MSKRPRAGRASSERPQRKRPTAPLLLGLILVAALLAALVSMRGEDAGGAAGLGAMSGAASSAGLHAAGRATAPGAFSSPGAGSASAQSSSGQPQGPPPGVDQPAQALGLPTGPPPYPPGSQPLTEGVDPSKTVPEDDPVDAKSGIHVIFGPRTQIVHPPDPIVVDLSVVDAKGNRLPISNGMIRVRPERVGPDGPWFTAPFEDDGSGADLTAGDLSYTATYLPSDSDRTALLSHGTHAFIEADFDAPNGLGPRDYVTTVMYTMPPGAELSGKYTDAVQDGSLVISAGVTVSRAGQYRLIGSLYGPDGQTAIAFAEQHAALGVGDQSIQLLFFGKILHDNGIDGPYVLRYVMLFEERPDLGDEYPGKTVDPAYTTGPYKAAAFSPQPYQPPPPDYPIVTAASPSQQGKPPPLFPDDRRAAGMQGTPPAAGGASGAGSSSGARGTVGSSVGGAPGGTGVPGTTGGGTSGTGAPGGPGQPN